MPSPTTLHADDFNVISFDASTGVLRFARTATHYPNKPAVIAAIAMLDAPSARVGARRLLLDSRLAPLRTDPEFEEASRTHFQPLLDRFDRVAVLVATATGKLQIRRIQREDRISLQMFDDEAKALAFLES